MTEHVLLVEDDDSIRELLHTRLAREGYSLSLARDGHEALAQLATATPSIMLLDLGLPHLNGYAVLETLAQQRPERSFPILIITADPFAATTLAHKPVQILRKPFALQSLITLMHEMLTDRKKDVRSPHPLCSQLGNRSFVNGLCPSCVEHDFSTSTPLVILTADEQAAARFEQQLAAVVRKPFPFETLLAVIHQYCHN